MKDGYKVTVRQVISALALNCQSLDTPVRIRILTRGPDGTATKAQESPISFIGLGKLVINIEDIKEVPL